MAMVLIIYYKQISEGYDDKERFAIMQKVGMSRREVKQSIRSQVMIVFFLPLVVAVVHIAVAFKVITKLLSLMNLTNVSLFMTSTIITVIVFAVFYAIVFAITAKEYYRIVDLKNPKRVIHALEICYMTGRTYTSFRTQQKKQRPFRILKVGLTRDREELYDRINRRVDQMMEEGLLEEVRSVLPYRHLNSLNTVGYKELFKYLDGEWELPFAIEKIKQNSRIYSRKQMTWFKRDEEIRWFHPEQETEILEYLRLQNLTHLPSLDTF